jgi:hypothetical protein
MSHKLGDNLFLVLPRLLIETLPTIELNVAVQEGCASTDHAAARHAEACNSGGRPKLRPKVYAEELRHARQLFLRECRSIADLDIWISTLSTSSQPAQSVLSSSNSLTYVNRASITGLFLV